MWHYAAACTLLIRKLFFFFLKDADVDADVPRDQRVHQASVRQCRVDAEHFTDSVHVSCGVMILRFLFFFSSFLSCAEVVEVV